MDATTTRAWGLAALGLISTAAPTPTPAPAPRGARPAPPPAPPAPALRPVVVLALDD